jgi:hypothetical protein
VAIRLYWERFLLLKLVTLGVVVGLRWAIYASACHITSLTTACLLPWLLLDQTVKRLEMSLESCRIAKSYLDEVQTN